MPFPHRPSRLSAAVSSACFWLLSAAAVPASAQVQPGADDARQLDTVVVNATRIDDNAGGRVGTKMDVPLRETPQSVSVVTREQMDRRGVQTVEEALRYSAGTSLPYGYDQRYDWVDVRGFQTVYDLYRDGLSQQGSTFGIPRFDPYALERIEVLKGPAGVMYGAGSPGGLINLVSKRPGTDAVNEIGATVGVHDRRELRADIGGALGGNGWLYRVVALAGENETEIDFNFNRKWLLMPSLRWQDEDTTFDLQATWQKVRSRQGNSVTVAPYAREVLTALGIAAPDIPRERFFGEPGFDRYDPEYRTFGWTFEHRFNDALTLRQNARYNRTDLDYRSHYLAGFEAINPDATNPYEVTRANLDVDESSRGMVVDTGLEAKFGGGRVAHTVLFGVDYRNVDNDENSGYGSGTNLDVRDPEYGLPVTAPQQFLTGTHGRQLGFYLQDHIKFDDRWVLLLGGRYDAARTASNGAFGPSRYSKEQFSGRAGLVYVGDGGFAPYLSYSEGFQPVNGVDPVTGTPFRPETSRQVELGTRWQPEGSDVLLSAAVFDLRKRDAILSDPVTFLRQQVGELRSRGFEAEANTMIAPNTRLIAAATVLDTEALRGNAGQPTGAPLPRVPDYTLAAYLDYTFAGGALDGLNIGAGVRHVGESTAPVTASLTTGERLDVDTPSYTLVDAGIHYPWQAWTFSLTGSNLSDRDYSISCTELTCYRGYGRRLDLSARYRW